MRQFLRSVFVAAVVFAGLSVARSQSPTGQPGWGYLQDPGDSRTYLSQRKNGPQRTPEQNLETLVQEVNNLKRQQQAAQAGAPQDQQQKQMELLQKQIETLEKMINVLAEQIKKQAPVQALQSRVSALENRAQQAARRDQEVAQAIDTLGEHMDAEERNGPRLPATLKELFLPSQTNETPISIYGQIFGSYRKFPNSRGAGEFSLDEFDPWFLLQLNDWIQLEVEVFTSPSSAAIDQGQLDFLVTDWLTVVAGRYITPTGWFNERAHPMWINKLPDFPLVLRQVAPADYSLNGLQLRGAFNLGGSPLKLEYSAYAGNGLGLPATATFTDLADIEAQKDSTANINEAMAYGGRLGLWYPELGLEAGASVFFNSPYSPLAGSDIQLWQLDFNYHKGNWDVRFEYADMRQGTSGLTGESIRRFGYYGQVAYRPYDACRFLQNVELIARYSQARFHGIDPSAIDFTAFSTPIDIPVNRNQYTFGINYYVYPSLVLKFAYEINHERNDIHLKDDVFLAQVAWGF